MPVYPGKLPPAVKTAATLEKEGYRELALEIDGHTGTHVDAPAHMLPEGLTLDRYPVSRFIGKARVLAIAPGSRTIGIQQLEPVAAFLPQEGFLLFNTGWSRFWGEEAYHRGYPVLTEEAARWLTALPVKGIGIDAISVDPVESEDWAIHHLLFRAGLIIVENLVFPGGFGETEGIFCCFPLPVSHADGAPVRAVFLSAATSGDHDFKD